MSKIGRKPIDIQDVTVEIKGREVHFTGKKSSGVYALPEELKAVLEGKILTLKPSRDNIRNINMAWGLNRALLFNKIHGASVGFEKKVQINGLGFKAALVGKNLDLTLGFSHKISLELPKDVTVEIDKTGQNLIFRSPDKELVGAVCDKVRSCRPPEPYKGTGVKLLHEVIIRKAGKAKSA